MEAKKKREYEAPEVMVVEMVFEGVICESNTKQSAGNPEDRNNAGDWGSF